MEDSYYFLIFNMQDNRAIAEIQFADYIFPAFDQVCLWFHSGLFYLQEFFPYGQ